MPRARAIALRVMWIALAVGAIAWALASYAAVYVGGGSMAPALAQGDLAVLRRGTAGVREGVIVWVSKRGRPNGALHRVQSVDIDDELILKGDANPVPDLVPTPVSDVRGVVVMSLPTGRAGATLATWARMLQSRLTKP